MSENEAMLNQKIIQKGDEEVDVGMMPDALCTSGQEMRVI
jgi:hypothetical protein